MKDFLPEKPIVVSPSLATAIGLEEALLIQLMDDLIRYRPFFNEGRKWLQMANHEWKEFLPFWPVEKVLLVLQSLSEQGLVNINAMTTSVKLYGINHPCDSNGADGQITEQFAHELNINEAQHDSMVQEVESKTIEKNSKFNLQQPSLQTNIEIDSKSLSIGYAVEDPTITEKCIVKTDKIRPMKLFNQQSAFEDKPLFLMAAGDEEATEDADKVKGVYWSNDKQSRRITEMHPDWRPYEESFEKLEKQHNISHEEVEKLIADFVFYWMEKGSSSATWNHKFVHWVINNKRFQEEKIFKRDANEKTNASGSAHRSEREKVKAALSDIHDFDW